MTTIQKLRRALDIIELEDTDPPIWATHEELWIYVLPTSPTVLADLDRLGWTVETDGAGQQGLCTSLSG